MLVFLLSGKEAKYLAAGNSLSFNNHLLWETVKEIQGNDLGYGNIVEDFSLITKDGQSAGLLSKLKKYDRVSTTERILVNKNELIIKVCLRYSLALWEIQRYQRWVVWD